MAEWRTHAGAGRPRRSGNIMLHEPSDGEVRPVMLVTPLQGRPARDYVYDVRTGAAAIVLRSTIRPYRANWDQPLPRMAPRGRAAGPPGEPPPAATSPLASSPPKTRRHVRGHQRSRPSTTFRRVPVRPTTATGPPSRPPPPTAAGAVDEPGATPGVGPPRAPPSSCPSSSPKNSTFGLEPGGPQTTRTVTGQRAAAGRAAWQVTGGRGTKRQGPAHRSPERDQHSTGVAQAGGVPARRSPGGLPHAPRANQRARKRARRRVPAD